MKVKATIEVEFELSPAQQPNAPHFILGRGLNGLTRDIEHGLPGFPSGVKQGSVKVRIISEETS